MPNPIPTNHATPIPASTATKLHIGDQDQLALLATCTGTPPTTTDTFQKGCIMFATDIATGSVGIYTNTGTSDTPVWNPVVTGGLSGANAPTGELFLLSNGGPNNVVVTAYTIGTTAVSLSTGLIIAVRLNSTLQIGANTVNFNGTTKNLRSHYNPANNIGTAYAAGGVLHAVYTPGVAGGVWQDLSR